MMRKYLKYFLFLFLFFSLLFISSIDKDNYKTGSYKSNLFVDPAGYNVYLPATFQYGFINNFPERMDSIVAYGFMLTKEKKVITKFTYGVALLQSPFYLTGLIICKAFNIPNTGYSPINNLIIDISGIFYACLGLFLLINVLSKYFKLTIAIISGLIIFIGTNTLYYATIQPGMSHIYSFFLVSLSLFSTHNFKIQKQVKWFILFCFAFALLVLIRPINIIYGVVFLSFGINTIEDFKNRLGFILAFKNVAIGILVASLIFIPQLIYWKFAYGKFIADSYPGESFAFLTNPQVKEYLFSPHNGLLSYNPLYVLFFVLTLFLIKKKSWQYLAILISAAIIIYLSASWYLFFFGCGFGARNFVEFSVFLAFPIADFFNSQLNRSLRIGIGVLIFFCVCFNLKMMAAWDVCFWGTNDWDWREYRHLLYQKPKSLALNLDSVNQKKVHLSGSEKVYKIDSLELYSPGINFVPNHLTSGYLKNVTISVDIYGISETSNAQLACMGFYKDSTLSYTAIHIKANKNKWDNFMLKTSIPFHATKEYLIKVFIMNNLKEEYLIKNFRISLN